MTSYAAAARPEGAGSYPTGVLEGEMNTATQGYFFVSPKNLCHPRRPDATFSLELKHRYLFILRMVFTLIPSP